MRKFLAVVLGLIFVMLLMLTTWAVSLRSFIFDANFYVSTLKAQGLFDRLEKDPLGVIDLNDQIPPLASVPADLQQRIIATVLPQGWLEKQATAAIQDWLTWFVAGEAGAPEVQIDLRQIKDRLQGPPGQQVAQDIVNAIPNCAPDEQPELSLTQLPKCIPPALDRSYIAEQVAQTLNTAAGQMPNEYDLGSRLSPSLRFGMRFNGRRVGVTLLDTSLLLLAVITIGLWVMAALLGGREKRGRWQWLGGLLLAGSVIVIVSSLFAFIFGAGLLPQAWLADLATETSELARGLIQALLQQLTMRSLLAGGILFIIGFGLLAWGYSRPSRQ